MTTMKLDKKRVLGLSAAVLALVATPVVWAQIGSVEVIADGLNNPRGLNFARRACCMSPKRAAAVMVPARRVSREVSATGRPAL